MSIANDIKGFYYDIQKNNPLTSVTLHANRKLNENNEWIDISESEKDEAGYSKEALCTAILTEDFSISIANSWTDFGGDPASQLWNDVVKPMAPYSDFLTGAIERMYDLQTDNPEAGGDSIAAGALRKVVNHLHKYSKDADTISDYMNRSLVVQGTRFSYYSGTGVSFNNMGMKFTIFPEYNPAGDFISIYDQLDKLHPYIMGQYIKEEKIGDYLENMGIDGSDVKEFIGWQKPPGGFKADIKNVDNIQKGTLELKFGSFYSISNLVVSDAQYTLSKQMVKIPRLNKAPTLSPLSCDINITLKPVTKYSDARLREFIGGMYTNEDRRKTEEQLQKSLDKASDNIKQLLN